MPGQKILCVAVNGDQVWAGTENGLVLIEGGRIQRVFGPDDGLAGRVVTAIAVDRYRGYVWIATFGGLSRYSGGQLSNYTSLASGLANDIVYDVAVVGNYVWATTAAGISRLDTLTGEWSIFSEASAPLGAPQAVGIAAGAEKIYFAIWGGGVLSYAPATARWIHLSEPTTQPSLGTGVAGHDFVTSVAYDGGTNALWVASHFGILKFHGGKWRHYIEASSGLPTDYVNAVHSRGGVLWVCTDRGLVYLDSETNTWITYRNADSNGHGVIRIVRPGRKLKEENIPSALAQNNVLNVAFQNTDIWVATAGGLSHGMFGNPQNVGASKPMNRVASEGSRVDDLRVTHNALPPAQAAIDLQKSPTVNIGFFGPLENSPESPYGLSMLHGAQLAIEDANASGGYHSGDPNAQPYALSVHNDSARWGASTTEIVKMAFDEHVVAALGPIDGASAHVMLRASLALEIPIVATAATDPSITNTRVPWVLRNFPDDRQQGAALADYIFSGLKRKRIGVIHSQSRQSRVGAQEFLKEAGRVAGTSIVEVAFDTGAHEFKILLKQLQDAGIEGLVIWAEPSEAGLILRQMRAIGMQQPVFGSGRIASPVLLASAGPAAEGLVAACALDPTRSDAQWQDFQRKYLLRFDAAPDPYAAYAYDGVMILIVAIERAGLSRIRIMEALQDLQKTGYKGAGGYVQFDHALNNISAVTMTRVEGGRFLYWRSDGNPRLNNLR
jgi:ABC-type branched-subunit amino acid transport system substrate-binding protein